MKKLLAVGVGLAVLVAFAGCGKVKEAAVQKAQEKAMEMAMKAGGNKDAKVDIKNGAMSVQTTNEKGEKVTMNIGGEGGNMTVTSSENGKTATIQTGKDSFSMKSEDTTFVSGEGAKVPDDFPKDVPVYSGAKVNSAMSSKESGGTFSLQLESKDDFSKVAEYYKKTMAEQGWKSEQTLENSGDNPSSMLNFSKEKRSCMVMVSKNNDAVQIGLTVANE